jgi:biotin transporter BioY
LTSAKLCLPFIPNLITIFFIIIMFLGKLHVKMLNLLSVISIALLVYTCIGFFDGLKVGYYVWAVSQIGIYILFFIKTFYPSVFEKKTVS